MKTFLLAYYNWYDGLIQFSEVTATSGLELIKEYCDSRFSKFKTEEEICQAEIKRGGFIGYEQIDLNGTTA
jgi:hypothetical protein